MISAKLYTSHIVNKKDNYLNQLDKFMNDNLITIADLINIKKSLEGDIKVLK